MYIIKKENVDSYRYSIAKIVFLELNSEIELIDNFIHSNIILVQSEDKGKFVISFFGKPTIDTPDYPIFVYYESFRSNKNEQDFKYKKLSTEFKTKYSRYLELAFKNPSVLITNLNEKGKEIFDSIVNTMNPSENMYKYRSQKSVKENFYGVVDGTISFSPPKSFNDPFDCNLLFSNNKDMKNIFRVLCLTEDFKNILMWSYYADSHKGYCFEYDTKEINKSIQDSEKDGLCIIGNVNYTDKRPESKREVSKFSYTDIKFYIDASFNKFSNWSHEKEFRYVIISKDTDVDDYLNFTIPVNNIYEGIEGDDEKIDKSKNIKLSKLYKCSKSFELNIKP